MYSYIPPVPVLNKKIKKQIEKTLKTCCRLIPNVPVSVFVFPWVGERYSEAFKGVNGYAPFKNVVHIFISLDRFSLKSLEETVVHEFSHCAFFNKKRNPYKLTLLEAMVMEGISENLREKSVGGKAAEWSKSLTKKETIDVLDELIPELDSQDHKVYENIFFGNKKYKKWSGYAIGYQLVKEFIKTNKRLSWNQIIQLEARDILGQNV